MRLWDSIRKLFLGGAVAKSFSDELDILAPYFEKGFERDLLTAAFGGLTHSGKLRPNNFAYAVRHLIDTFLKRLAPDEEIIRCSWYENLHPDPVNKPNYITHKQRMHYTLTTGMRLDHSAFEYLDLEDRVNDLKVKRQELNGYTHIEEELFALDEDEQDDVLEEIIDTLHIYLVALNELNSEVENSVEGSVSMEIFDEYINSNDLDLMDISSGYMIDGVHNEENNLKSIDQWHIKFSIAGTVDVTQKLGSHRDGVEVEGNYPFSCEIWFPCTENSWINGEVHNLTTDTRSWFE